jgi:hypothetical protein
MSETKFTKGRWYCANYSARAAQTGKFIAHADNNSVDDAERKANAHLIAAAPELYAMLDKILNSTQPASDFYAEAEQLLTKARGEL